MEPRQTIVRVTSDHHSWTHAKPDFDAARRIPDQFGRPGIEAKTGQTNPVIRKNRELKLRFTNPKLAQDCANLIVANGPLSLNVDVIKPPSVFAQRMKEHTKRLQELSHKTASKRGAERRKDR